MKRIIYILSFTLLSFGMHASDMNFGWEINEDVSVIYRSSEKSINISLAQNEPVYLAVFNILGNRVMLTKIPYENSRVDVSRLESGQYIVKIFDRHGHTLKLSKIVVY